MTERDTVVEKRAAATAAAAMVEDGMRVGLGTGTTVAELVPAIARRRLAITCVATSPATAELASALGLDVQPFTEIDRLDLAIDGADQVDPAGWLIKGGRWRPDPRADRAAAADRSWSSTRRTSRSSRSIRLVPLELLAFGLAATLRGLRGPHHCTDAPHS